jgi:hypothetical protein
VTRESDELARAKQRLRKAEAAMFAARAMLSRCSDELKDERESLKLDVKEATDDFFSVQEEVARLIRSGERMQMINEERDFLKRISRDVQVAEEMQEGADAIDALMRGVEPEPVTRAAPMTFTKLTRDVERSPRFPVLQPDAGILAKTDTSTRELDKALNPEPELSASEVEADNRMRKRYGLDPLPEPEVGARVTLQKSVAVLTDAERQAAYRSGRRLAVGHSVLQVDPETGEEHLVRVVTGYR